MLFANPVFIPYFTFTKGKNQGKMLVLNIIVVGLISSTICKLDHFSSLLTIISNLVVNVIHADCLIHVPSRDAGRHCLLGAAVQIRKRA